MEDHTFIILILQDPSLNGRLKHVEEILSKSVNIYKSITKRDYQMKMVLN